jgi:hypothetical protein
VSKPKVASSKIRISGNDLKFLSRIPTPVELDFDGPEPTYAGYPVLSIELVIRFQGVGK